MIKTLFSLKCPCFLAFYVFFSFYATALSYMINLKEAIIISGHISYTFILLLLCRNNFTPFD